nr:hypothetical protein CFP56_10458 [Quercus suber]
MLTSRNTTDHLRIAILWSGWTVHRQHQDTEMFDCVHCTTRAIRTIAKEASLARPRARFEQHRLLLTPQLGRRLHSQVATAPSQAPRNGVDALAYGAGQLGDDAAKAQYESAIKKELQWLQDPLKLADHVHYTLRCNQSAKALDLVRRASRTMNCVVSWNHIVDWLMKQEKSYDAIRVYNEMKKRAQFPDSYTYILLLRGLIIRTPSVEKAEQRRRAKDHVSKAVQIYNSMSSPTSRVKPSVIHLNALLRVCSFASDLDAFWGVAGQIPEQGPGAADHITYTTILDAIRHGATSHLPTDFSEEDIAKYQLEAVGQALRIWPEIITKWRNGIIRLDDALVAAMGRVLLLSPRIEEWDAVLNLVEQTMDIERLVSKLGSPDRKTGHVPQTSNHSPKELASDTANMAATSDSQHATPASRAFDRVKPVNSKSKTSAEVPSLLFAKPGNSTLSALVQACDKMRVPSALNAYWDRFTKEGGVVPDASNFDALLSNLYLNRGSFRAATIISEMVASGTTPTKSTLQKAMKVCRRDFKNHSMMDSATTILKAMDSSLSDADPALCMQYLSLAQSTGDGPKITFALDMLDTAKTNLMSYLNYGPAGDRKPSISADLFHKELTLRLFELMVSVMDTLMNRALVPREDFNHFHARRKELTSFITRARENVLHAQAKLPSALVDKIRISASNVGTPKAYIPSLIDKPASRTYTHPPTRTNNSATSNDRVTNHTTAKGTKPYAERHASPSSSPSRGARRDTVVRDQRKSERTHRASRPTRQHQKEHFQPSGFADSPADLGM